MPELLFSAKDSGMAMLFGDHKITQTLGVACLPVLCVDLCQDPSSIPRLVFAFVDGQGLQEKPVLRPQPANTPKDSLPEQINFRAPLLPGWSAGDQPELWFGGHLTDWHSSPGATSQLGGGAGRGLPLCPQPRGRGQAHLGTPSACSFPAGRSA